MVIARTYSEYAVIWRYAVTGWLQRPLGADIAVRVTGLKLAQRL